VSEHSYSKGRTPLTFAALSGDADSVRTLLEGGADPNQTDSTGRTVLQLAERYGYWEVVKIWVVGDPARDWHSCGK